MDLKSLEIADTASENVKGKRREDIDEDAITAIQDSEEEEEDDDDESKKPLEIGGFLTPLDEKAQPPIDPPKETLARDLSPGKAIIASDGSPCEISARTDTRALQGPLASRHQIALELIDLWDRDKLERLVVKATEKMREVAVRRGMYEVVGLPFFLSLLDCFCYPFPSHLQILHLSHSLTHSLSLSLFQIRPSPTNDPPPYPPRRSTSKTAS